MLGSGSLDQAPSKFHPMSTLRLLLEHAGSFLQLHLGIVPFLLFQTQLNDLEPRRGAEADADGDPCCLVRLSLLWCLFTPDC